MPKKYRLMLCILSLSLLLSGCSLLPEEEEIKTAPILRTVPPLAFREEAVQRGDMIKTVRVSCKYVPVQTKGLSFPISGVYFDKMFVQVGDYVQEGQLMAQLDLGDLETQIESIERTMEELQMRIDYLGEQYLLEKKRCEILYESSTDEERLDAFSDLEADFATREKAYGDELYIQKLKLETLTARLQDRQIFAPFSGTVTYVKKFSDGEKSSARSSVITLIDSTITLFRAETKYWDYFENGEVCMIEVADEYLEAVVTDEETLGIEKKEKIADKIAPVYLVLSEPNFQLEDGDYGYYTLVLDERYDVLHVSKDAISYAGEQPIVYYVRPDGMKAYKTVEIGITVNDRIEIISGLEEGEQIIVN